MKTICFSRESLRELVKALVCCDAVVLGRLHVTATFKGISFHAIGDIAMDIKDTDVPGTVTLTIGPPKDPKGNPATLDGVPVWAAQADQTNVTLVSTAPDGLSADFHITDALAATQVSVSADARMGPDVVPLSSVFVFNVMASEATSLGDISAGAIKPD